MAGVLIICHKSHVVTIKDGDQDFISWFCLITVYIDMIKLYKNVITTPKEDKSTLVVDKTVYYMKNGNYPNFFSIVFLDIHDKTEPL